MPGPPIRTDIVDVYVFRLPAINERSQPLPEPVEGLELLQMRRAREPMKNTWQPVMGHVEEDETAAAAALRELEEETAYNAASGNLLHFWQLEGVNTYFMGPLNEIVMSPCFAALVAAEKEPTLDDSHDAYRWVKHDAADNAFTWPGQRRAVTELLREILQPGAPMRDALKINL